MLNYALMSSLRKYINSSTLLLIATVAALIVANSSLSTYYHQLWAMPMSLSIGTFNFFTHGQHVMSLKDVINDLLMGIFFLSVGLEIKREMLCGELSSFKKALAPVIAACGGMIVPVMVYLLICNENADMQRGMAIPMATDIAFSLGCLSIFVKRCPISLKIFLAALAVTDDLGGIIVIAVKYTEHLNVDYLGLALISIIILLIGNRKMIRTKTFYLSIGLILWYAMLNSGIHATIAGVILAFCIPANLNNGTQFYLHRISQNMQEFPITEINDADRKKAVVLTPDQVSRLKSIESASDHLISVLQDLEDALHAPINYIIIPLFAFANANIDFADMHPSDLFSGVGLGVFLGLLVGKFLGIFCISWICIKLNIIQMPRHATWSSLAGISMICGIGFTVSIFMSNLSFPTAEYTDYLNNAKLGIISSSVASALLGCIMLHFTLPNEEEMNKLRKKDEAELLR